MLGSATYLYPRFVGFLRGVELCWSDVVQESGLWRERAPMKWSLWMWVCLVL